VCNNSRNFFSAHSNLHWKLPENNVNHFHNNNNDKQVFQNTVQLSEQSVEQLKHLNYGSNNFCHLLLVLGDHEIRTN
jgi:hypothetical protein